MTLHLVKVLVLKRYMSIQTGCFQYTKSSHNLGMILKRVMASLIGNVLGLMRVMCKTRDTCLSLSTREYNPKKIQINRNEQ